MSIYKYLLNYLLIRETSVIIDILRHASIESSIIFHCYNASATLQMHKVFNVNNMRLSNQKIGQHKVRYQPHNHRKLGMVVNTSCDGWTYVFEAIDIKRSFKSPFIWIILTKDLAQTVYVLSLYKIELDSDVKIVCEHENSHSLYEVYHTGFFRNGQFLVRNIGWWNGSLHLKVKDRRDLKGLVLRNTVVILKSQNLENKTFVRYLDEVEPDLVKTDPVHKFKSYIIFKYFRDLFNVTYELTRTSSWGYHSNGSYNGMAGSLQRSEVELGGSPLFIRADRMHVLDYVAEAWQTKPCFIFRDPKRPGSWFRFFTRPLSNDLWLWTAILLILFAVVLGVIMHYDISDQPGNVKDPSRGLGLLVVWSAICQQGVSITHSSNSIKIMVFSILIFGLILYQFYNAALFSTLLKEEPQYLKTLKDLMKSNMKAGIEDILYNKDYFLRTTEPVARELFQKKVALKSGYNYFTAEEGLAMVQKGGFAFHIDGAVAYRHIRRKFSREEICELREIPVFSPHTALVVAKHSPYKELLAYGVRKLTESGVMNRLAKMWDAAERPPCVRASIFTFAPVGLTESAAAFAVLTLGGAASLLVLFVEILVHKRTKSVHVNTFVN